jgi:hypothetical protein
MDELQNWKKTGKIFTSWVIIDFLKKILHQGVIVTQTTIKTVHSKTNFLRYDAMESVTWVPTYKLNFCVHQFVLLIWWKFYSTMVHKIHIFIIIYNAIYVNHNKPYHKNIQSCTGTAKIIFICIILKPQIFTTIRPTAAGWNCRIQMKMHYEISSSCSPRKKVELCVPKSTIDNTVYSWWRR